MRRLWSIVTCGLLLAWSGSAQNQASTQTKASTSTQASAQAGKTGAQTGAKAEAEASQEARVQKQGKGLKRAQAEAGASGAGSASASAESRPLELDSNSTIEAVLTKTVDARKNKAGDRVEAKTAKDVKSDGRVVLPRNSKLLGHVTEAQARGKGESESSLGIVFDRAVLKDGREVPLHVVVQAVAAAESAASAATFMGDDTMARASGAGRAQGAGSAAAGGSGGLLGGVGSTVGATTGAVAGTAGSVAGSAASTVDATTGAAVSAAGSGGAQAVGRLTSSSTGVLGLEGLSLQSAGSGESQGSLLVSATRNVRLESGTRLLLAAAGAASAEPKK
jgi:hypothetical protein